MQALLLENVRFHPGEETCDPAFVADLAKLGQVFVNDAFGACHRDQASVTGLAAAVPRCYPGPLLRKEVEYLMATLEKPRRCAFKCICSYAVKQLRW
jgi:phosphoglycerate kinase